MAICRSTDAGITWKDHKLIGSAHDDVDCFCMAISPADSTRIYVAGYENQKAKIWHSTDISGSWQDRTGNLNSLYSSSSNWIRTLCVSPFNPDRLLAGTYYGVCLSEDGGVSWKETSLNREVTALAYDTVRNKIYAGTDGNGVFQSADGGVSWEPMNDLLDFQDVRCMAMDEQSGTLYIGTEDGSAWCCRTEARVQFIAEPASVVGPSTSSFTLEWEYVDSNATEYDYEVVIGGDGIHFGSGVACQSQATSHGTVETTVEVSKLPANMESTLYILIDTNNDGKADVRNSHVVTPSPETQISKITLSGRVSLDAADVMVTVNGSPAFVQDQTFTAEVEWNTDEIVIQAFNPSSEETVTKTLKIDRWED